MAGTQRPGPTEESGSSGGGRGRSRAPGRQVVVASGRGGQAVGTEHGVAPGQKPRLSRVALPRQGGNRETRLCWRRSLQAGVLREGLGGSCRFARHLTATLGGLIPWAT